MKLFAILLGAALTAVPALLAAEDIVAQVGKEKITVSELAAAIRAEATAAQRELTEQEKRAVLNALVNQRLLVAEAKDRKLDRDEPVERAIESRTREVLAQAMLEKEVNPAAQVSPEEVKDFYEKNPQLFEVARVSQILVRPLSPDKKSAAKKEAERLKKKATANNFADLAREHSDDELSRERGGDLGLLRRNMLLPELEKAVFGAKQGAYLLVETQFGFHVLRVVEKRRETFEQAAPLIQRELARLRYNDRQTALIKELTKKFKVKVKDKLIP